MKRIVVAFLFVSLVAGHGFAASDGLSDADALVYFAGVGDLEKVKGLVFRLGVDVNQRNSMGITPLAAASNNGHLAVVRFLVERKAKIDARVFMGQTPLMAAAANGHTDIAKLLIDNGADDTLTDGMGMTAFKSAETGGHRDTAAFLYRWARSRYLQNLLGTYVIQNDLRGIRKALDAGANIDYDGPLHDFLTPLMLAASKSQLRAAKVLLDEGASVNMVNGRGSTALFVAVRSRDQEMVELLIEHGARVHGDEDAKSPLTQASRMGWSEMVRCLEERRDKEIHMDRLIEERIALEKALDEFRCRQSGSLTEVERAQALKNLDRLTELQDIMRPLCSNADLRKLTFQAEFDRGNVLEHPRRGVTNPDAPDRLMEASFYSRIKDVRQLLQAGANPKSKNGIEETPLLAAVFAHYLRNGVMDGLGTCDPVRTVQALLEAGADINAPDLRGWTPLMIAAYDGDQELAALLLKKGADANIKNSAGDTALMLARKKDQQEVIRLLEKQPATKASAKGQQKQRKPRVEAPNEE